MTCVAMNTKMWMVGMTNRGFKNGLLNFMSLTPRRNQAAMLTWNQEQSRNRYIIWGPLQENDSKQVFRTSRVCHFAHVAYATKGLSSSTLICVWSNASWCGCLEHEEMLSSCENHPSGTQFHWWE
jgi:hypothetical protein